MQGGRTTAHPLSRRRALLRVLVLLLGCLVVQRASGLEHGTVPVFLVGLLPLVLLPAWPALLVALLRRDRLLAVGAAALVVAHVLVVLPTVRTTPGTAAGRTAPRLRVAVANLYVLNQEPEATGRALRGLGADVLVVPELGPAGAAGLRASGLLEDYPYRLQVDDVVTEEVGLLSRLPLRDVDLRRGDGRVLPRATVDVGGVPVRVLAGHPLPPVWLLEAPWRRSLAALADEAGAATGPVVVVGDLNADRDQGAFRPLFAAGLRDAADERGRGLVPTWPAGLPFQRLDHVLVRDGRTARVEVRRVDVVRLPGTDHRAVVADLAVVAQG